MTDREPIVELQAVDPAMLPPATLEVWRRWLRRHSIDPADVAAPAGIVRDEGNRTVSYFAYKRDDTGHVVLVDGYTQLELRRVQLESAPAPFPKVTA